MRLKHKVNLRAWEDTAQKNCLFAPDDVLSEITLDGFQRIVSGRFNIAGAATEALSFGDVDTVYGLIIIVDGTIGFDLDLNGLGVVPYRPGGTGTGAKTKYFGEALISSASITNPDAATAINGSWAAWGDPTP